MDNDGGARVISAGCGAFNHNLMCDRRGRPVTGRYPSYRTVSGQPEAKHLYLTSGYEPQFDLDQDPEII